MSETQKRLAMSESIIAKAIYNSETGEIHISQLRVNKPGRIYFGVKTISNLDEHFLENGDTPIAEKKCFICCQRGCCGKNYIQTNPGDTIYLKKMIRVSYPALPNFWEAGEFTSFMIEINGKRIAISEWMLIKWIRYGNRWLIVRNKKEKPANL